jgi:carbonic anhydrase
LNSSENGQFLGSITNGSSKSVEQSVREDIALIKASPLIKKSTVIVGLMYDINSGLLTEVKNSGEAVL